MWPGIIYLFWMICNERLREPFKKSGLVFTQCAAPSSAGHHLQDIPFIPCNGIPLGEWFSNGFIIGGSIWKGLMIWTYMSMKIIGMLRTGIMSFQMQVAEVIKDDLWPNPLKYFNNVSPVCTSSWFCLSSEGVLLRDCLYVWWWTVRSFNSPLLSGTTHDF